MNIAVLGDGAWGSAMAKLLCTSKHNVALWGPFPDYIKILNKTRSNPKFLPEIKFPKQLLITDNIEKAVDNKDIIVLALPSQYIRDLLQKLKPYYTKKQIILNLAKGIENETLNRVSQIVQEILGGTHYAVLSGPSHAEEVCNDIPTAVVVAAKNLKTAKLIQANFTTSNFRIYLSSDVIGIELGGALKNVYSIAAGICDGMQLGDNAKAALITRSIAEMSRLGKILGGQVQTFSGLSGIGDLIVTCYSKHSRNRFVGERLGLSYKLQDIISELGMAVAEGIKTTKSAYMLAKKHNSDTPIINELYATLYNNKNPKNCIIDLMNRLPKSETY